MTVKDERLWIGGMGKEWTTPDGVSLWHILFGCFVFVGKR
jgi:hypothetical protein